MLLSTSYLAIASSMFDFSDNELFFSWKKETNIAVTRVKDFDQGSQSHVTSIYIATKFSYESKRIDRFYIFIFFSYLIS